MYRVDVQPADLAAILPNQAERDRLGIISRTPGGALDASVPLMAAITTFSGRERARADEFFRYPNYYVFHIVPHQPIDRLLRDDRCPAAAQRGRSR